MPGRQRFALKLQQSVAQGDLRKYNNISEMSTFNTILGHMGRDEITVKKLGIAAATVPFGKPARAAWGTSLGLLLPLQPQSASKAASLAGSSGRSSTREATVPGMELPVATITITKEGARCMGYVAWDPAACTRRPLHVTLSLCILFQ